MEFKTSITKEEIGQLPLLNFPGKVRIITNTENALRALRSLKGETVLGFDTETRPSFRKGEFYHVALLQLATEDAAYLFRLNKFDMPQEIADLLADPNIIKTGVAVHDDIKALQKLVPFEPGGFVDLAVECQKKNITTFGLRALTAIFMGQRLSKNAKISNWEQRRLSEAQIQYAATDAWSGLQIYNKLQESSSQSHH